MTPEHLIQLADSRNEFLYGQDGFMYYCPGLSGLLTAWELRVIADELDKRNAGWQAKIDKDLEDLP